MYIYIYIYICTQSSNIQIQVVCMSVGREDECTNGASGLRDSGLFGGKVGELGKVVEAFVVKC